MHVPFRWKWLMVFMDLIMEIITDTRTCTTHTSAVHRTHRHFPSNLSCDAILQTDFTLSPAAGRVAPLPLCVHAGTHTHTHTHTLQHKVRGVMIKDWQVAVERSGVVVPGKAAAVSGVASARDGVSAPGIAAAPVTAPCELLLRGFLLTRSQTRTRRANRHKCCQTYDVYIHLTHKTRRHFESCVLFNHLFITL